MGKPFIEPPALDISLVFKDSSALSPLVFVLSTGCDPFASFKRFAKEAGFDGKFENISLG